MTKKEKMSRKYQKNIRNSEHGIKDEFEIIIKLELKT